MSKKTTKSKKKGGPKPRPVTTGYKTGGESKEWNSIRIRVATIVKLKKLVVAIRRTDPTATLDSVVNEALALAQDFHGISKESLAATRLPADGRAAGAQARAAARAEAV